MTSNKAGIDWDYIVVGGGTAGLVVANRLAEDPDSSVLVLEAGRDYYTKPIDDTEDQTKEFRTKVNVPGLFTTLLGDQDFAYLYKTVPQSGLNGREVKEPQGKMLGGSSAINGQTFTAPSKADIDAWSKLGNSGWNWSSLHPYYKKLYTLTSPPDKGTREHLGIDEWLDHTVHGTDGPIQVSFPGVKQTPLCKAWIEAFQELKYPGISDPFSGKSVGGYSTVSAINVTSKERSYSASAYGVTGTKNLTIAPSAIVQKIIFDSSSTNVTATGVRAFVNGQLETYTAAKEVILSAGVYNTPKLLELSGIGNEALLRKHGIEPVISNPGVGENLQDHIMTGISFEVVDGTITGDALMRGEAGALAFAQQMYFEHKAGPLAAGGVQSLAFMPIPEFADADDQTSQKDLLDKYAPPKDSKEAEHYNITRTIIENPEEVSAQWFMFLAQANLHENGDSFVGTQLQPENFASLGCYLAHPFSRGFTHIRSADVDAMPAIDPQYFSNPIDLELMARHVQALETLRQTPKLAKYFKSDGKRNHPDAFHIKDLEVAKKYLRDTALTTYHGCGTAAMLPREKGGVVDEKLKVYGTTNLRIVDASIFPLIPRNNTMSIVLAVAEKAADIIKGSLRA